MCFVKSFSRYFISVMAALLLVAVVSAVPCRADESSPKREMRGVWLATVWGIDWPSVSGTSRTVRERQQKELCAILDRCEAVNLTSVFFQVRGMGDVMFDSKVEPWSSFVSGERGVSPGWDPLQFAVEECHRRGLECYAWVNPFRWSSGTDYKSLPDKKWKDKGWLLGYGKYTVFNPGLEEVREHIVWVCREIVTAYDVDGLVFDDYFYPNRIPETEEAGDFKLWQSQSPWMTFGDWRRANVHKTIADVHYMLADLRPDVRFGISPAGVAGKSHTSAEKWGMVPSDVKADDWQYNEIYSDPLGWLYQGTIDFVSPQIYWSSTHQTAPYQPIARWWSEAAGLYGSHFYSSVTMAPLGKANTPEQRDELVAQVLFNREASLTGEFGTVLYSAKFLPKLASDLSASCFAVKALPPVLRRIGDVAPMQPVGLTMKHGILSWNAADEGSDSLRSRRYVVYAFPAHLSLDDIMSDDGDGLKSEYIVRVCYGTSAVVPAGMAYAVTALAGNAEESTPAFLR